MLKKTCLRKTLVTSFALVITLLIYFFPSNSNNINVEKSISYVNESNKDNIYLIDKHNYVSMVSTYLDNDELIDKLKEKINFLIIDSNKSNSIPNGFRAIIPRDTKILDLKVNEDSVYINFSKDILKVSSLDEEGMIESIIYTLTTDKIKNVYILVDNVKLDRMPNSRKLLPYPLTRKFGVNKFYDFNNLHGLTLTTVYYIGHNNEDKYYVPISKISNDNREKVEVIIDELKSNIVYQSNLGSYLNANAELKNYELLKDSVHLSFNDKLFDSVNNKLLEEVEYSIKLSIKDNYDVNEVLFYVDDNLIMQ